MSDSLIAAHRDIAALAPYLHLPVQIGLRSHSGGDEPQAHRSRDYLDIVARARRARPDIALSSDFIVGFPGESDADFEATLALVREVGFASAYAFKYSPRPGTPAAEARRSRSTTRVKIGAARRAAGAAREPAARLQSGARRAPLRRSVRQAGPAAWSDRRPLALYAAGLRRGRRALDRRDGERRDHRRGRQFADRADRRGGVMRTRAIMT